ncbi:mechanosensitive ion channel family protein [Planktothrix sp. FACHB-1355]|uniref:Mechanosensitive ion channel family protein n=1 Tax=Aerosakkonema funiforme FACHB-1375 TaxID=2949571 RepID=A0A926VHU8_9CYAN|nr:mechanosensitive ion channel domain-containing protein [Aerosakkonema funiforme]MBD2182909.1 mechanosensitive ion channel family protein [Aerosakkonema funiforme FACHB-1375]MBD3557367.1 mechanosensitive ion channel family protein [Planktothrix sp. FACHB-1355]
MDIVIILAEVGVLILAFSVFYWLVGISFKLIKNVSWLEGKTEKLLGQRRNIRRGLIFLCAMLCLLLVVGNGFLIFQGKNVLEIQVNLIRGIPPQLWLNLVAASFKTVILLWLVRYGIPPLHRFLDLACVRAQNFDDIEGNDESIAVFFNFLKTNLTNIIWIFVLILSSQFFGLPKLVPNYLSVGLKIYIIIAIGLLIVKAISTIVETIDVVATRNARPDNLLRFYEPLRHLVTLLKKRLEYVIYVGIATIVVQQIDFLAWMAVYGTKILEIIGIFFISGVLIQVANAILEDLVLRSEDLTELQKQRRLTIIPLFKSFLRYAIYFTAAVTILKLIGIDPTPILAGVGILGIAVGFGAQNLINDIVCGFFILFENYYLVGDYIEVNQASGFVEAIDLRTTRIRHSNGQQHILRNGEIKDIVNYSKQYIYAVVEVGISYDTDLNYVYEILEGIGKDLKKNYPEVLQPTLVEGVEKFGSSELLIRTITKVKPGNHFRIERTLRKMIKDVFDREGITFPDSANVVILNNQPNNGDSKVEN